MSGWSPQVVIDLESYWAKTCVKLKFPVRQGSIEYFALIRGIQELSRTSRKLSARECERILAPPGFFHSIRKIFGYIVLCIF